MSIELMSWGDGQRLFVRSSLYANDSIRVTGAEDDNDDFQIVAKESNTTVMLYLTFEEMEALATFVTYHIQQREDKENGK